jgi:hypothetical protein
LGEGYLNVSPGEKDPEKEVETRLIFKEDIAAVTTSGRFEAGFALLLDNKPPIGYFRDYKRLLV